VRLVRWLAGSLGDPCWSACPWRGAATHHPAPCGQRVQHPASPPRALLPPRLHRCVSRAAPFEYALARPSFHPTCPRAPHARSIGMLNTTRHRGKRRGHTRTLVAPLFHDVGTLAHCTCGHTHPLFHSSAWAAICSQPHTHDPSFTPMWPHSTRLVATPIPAFRSRSQPTQLAAGHNGRAGETQHQLSLRSRQVAVAANAINP